LQIVYFASDPVLDIRRDCQSPAFISRNPSYAYPKSGVSTKSTGVDTPQSSCRPRLRRGYFRPQTASPAEEGIRRGRDSCVPSERWALGFLWACFLELPIAPVSLISSRSLPTK